MPALALFALTLTALALSSSASAAVGCPSVTWSNPPIGSFFVDSDGDGLFDSIDVYEISSPWMVDQRVFANATLRNGSNPVVASVNTYANVSSTVVWGYDLMLTVPANRPAGNYTVTITFDEGTGTCQTIQGTYYLYPLGDYGISLARSTANLTVDQGTDAVYNFTVRSEGNNEDTVSLYADSSQGWGVEFSLVTPTLGPSSSMTIVMTVHVPANADPNTVDETTVTGISLRNAALEVALAIKTTVSAQVFSVELTADDATLSAWPGAMMTFTLGVENAGNNHDTLTMHAPEAPLGWSFEFEDDQVSLDAGALGTTILYVWASSSLAGATAWSPTISVSSGNGQTTATLQVTASMVLPDLVLTDGDLSADGAGARAGDTVMVHATVRNVGATVAFESVVSVSDGTKAVSTTVSFDATGVAVASFAWIAEDGQGPLHVTADSTHAVPESNEDNNAATLALTVNRAPHAQTPTPTASAQAGSSLTLSADGSTDPDGTIVAYNFDFGDGSTTGWITTASAAHTYADAGTYFAKVSVRDNAGLDSEAATAVVTVAAAPPGSGGSTTTGASSGGSDIAFSLVGLIAGLGAGMGLMAVMARKKPPAAPPST